ncbi:hypothetical protein FA95DRAFT_1609219 [Auriscalpium vulgare]|uniref:Uncharacterized protein n=1 Tax=Auriscalpium vulgare TaxID=40419 RepID=A0ACB8RHM2_9AGAM|nr:hypothetical protein FA95DRAFT_1609219 [Auriscalpium vulgare]
MGPCVRVYDDWYMLLAALSHGSSCHYDVYTDIMDVFYAWLHVMQPHYATASAWAVAHQREHWLAHSIDTSTPGSPSAASSAPHPPAPPIASPLPATSVASEVSIGDHLATYFTQGPRIDVSITRTIEVQEELADNASASPSIGTDGLLSPRPSSQPPIMAPPSPMLWAHNVSSPSPESLGGFSLLGMMHRVQVDSAAWGDAWYSVVRGFSTGVMQGPYEYLVADAVKGYYRAFYRAFQDRQAAIVWFAEHRDD